jgi:hypothetical protein
VAFRRDGDNGTGATFSVVEFSRDRRFLLGAADDGDDEPKDPAPQLLSSSSVRLSSFDRRDAIPDEDSREPPLLTRSVDDTSVELDDIWLRDGREEEGSSASGDKLGVRTRREDRFTVSGLSSVSCSDGIGGGGGGSTLGGGRGAARGDMRTTGGK